MNAKISGEKFKKKLLHHHKLSLPQIFLNYCANCNHRFMNSLIQLPLGGGAYFFSPWGKAGPSDSLLISRVGKGKDSNNTMAKTDRKLVEPSHHG